jgi:STAS domain
MFEIAVSEVDGQVPVTIYRLKGSFDSAAIEAFEAQARLSLDRGDQNILLDMRELNLMTSVGLRAITNLYYDLHPRSSDQEGHAINEGIRAGTYTAPHLKLLDPPKNIRKVLDTTGMTMVLEIFKKEKEAIKSFV